METPLLGAEPHNPLANSGLEQQQLRACGDGCGLSSDPEDVIKRKAATKKLSWAIVFCLVFMVVEVGGGIYANSLAILTDAAHLLSDVASFAISLFAIYASGWDATPKQSYGFHRVEILGALVSIHIIWLLTGILVYEAITRCFHDSKPVDGKLMFIIAAFGLAVNVGMMLILGHSHAGHSHAGHSHAGHSHSEDEHQHEHHEHGADDHHQHDHQHGQECQHDLENGTTGAGHEHGRIQLRVDSDVGQPKVKDNINVRGAYLHVLGDLVQSVGVMLAGAVIWWRPEWKIVDLICTLCFSGLVLLTTVNMWRDISEVLMESTPREIDATLLEEGLMQIDNVEAVHELHIWAITLGKVLLACHVKIAPHADADEVLKSVIHYCERDFKISHVTIQIERD